jgi:hypothetical protein
VLARYPFKATLFSEQLFLRFSGVILSEAKACPERTPSFGKTRRSRMGISRAPLHFLRTRNPLEATSDG